MGKLFKKKKGYSDEDFEDDDDELETEDDEEEDDDIEDDEDEIDEDEDDEDEDDDEIEEDDDEDEDDDEIEEDDDEEEYDEEEERRMYRRHRRIRNQIIAYSVVVVILAGIITGCVLVGKSISSRIQNKKQQEEMAKQLEEAEAQAAQEVVIEAPETTAEEPEEDYLGEVVDAYISEMPLEDKVAGLFFITPEALTGVDTVTQAGDGTQTALNENAVGGLVYFSRNIKDKDQLTEMLSNTVNMSKYPLFLAVDEEGGSVSRVADSSIEVIKVDDMATIGATGDTSAAYEAGVTIGSYLKELGFNVDFAPVADVVTDVDNSAIGSRSFGGEPEQVGTMVANMVEGLEGTGVSSCLKHFPGLGDTTEDTHDGRVATEKTLDEMRSTDFIPFQKGIESGADFVMVSHVIAAAIDDSGIPSSLSEKVVTDTLRNEMGYDGIVITDALDMTAITDYYTSGEAAVMAVEAGVDMLLMPESYQEAYEAVLTAVQDGTISEERINESLTRIYRIKCADKLN